MKPQHASVIRISRCACCVSRYSKHHAGTSKNGNSAARQNAKRNIRKDIN
jgi:hypothetical protein